jgi:DNA polymerase-3 subunit delta'
VPLASIISHAPIVGILRRAVARNRVPQSLIFAGPEGVGKHATAVALAQAVNCPRRTDDDACGVCPTCVRIAAGRHSDVTMLDRGGEASIKIRALRERVLDVIAYRPFEAARRVFIIDPADLLTVEAQDALLKTLEEPPPSAILMLVTAYPDTLLATVQSRCRRLRFGLLSEADVARVLVDHTVTRAADAKRLAAVSGGRVGRALEEASGDLDDDRAVVLDVLGAALRPSVPAKLKAAAALAKYKSKASDREALARRLAMMASVLRDVGLRQAKSDEPLANADVADAVSHLASGFDLPRTSDAFAAVFDAEQALERNAGPKIVADWLAVTL